MEDYLGIKTESSIDKYNNIDKFLMCCVKRRKFKLKGDILYVILWYFEKGEIIGREK